jgi:carbamoyl-phosphate synthase small subunit
MDLDLDDHSIPAFLILHDGTVFQGYGFGASNQEAFGEVVFNTSMSGYQEMLTDPSYSGQILVPTYPLQGNYGINNRDIESSGIKVNGFVVREHCEFPSNRYSNLTLDEYLTSQSIPAIHGIDTRALTRRIRSHGVMMGLITQNGDISEAKRKLNDVPNYEDQNLVRGVSAIEPYSWPIEDGEIEGEESFHIVVLDQGVKFNILRLLKSRGCRVTVVPSSTDFTSIMHLNPDGVLLSPGPGDPRYLDDIVEVAKQLVENVPVLGICLGHQVAARALGAETYKLKFGHRGGNHPVKDLSTNMVRMTAQNHGYAVEVDSLPSDLKISQINLNDGTVEGLEHTTLPLLTIQYHSEASPGPLENEFIFDRFLNLIDKIS